MITGDESTIGHPNACPKVDIAHCSSCLAVYLAAYPFRVGSLAVTMTALHHPFSDLGMRDPYPLLAAIRRTRPAWYDKSMGMWLLTSHQLCRVALRDPSFSAAQGQQQRVRSDDLPISMLNTDGDLHRRLRTPAAAVFTAKAASSRTDEIRAQARTVLAALPPTGAGRNIDVASAISAPFAVAVLGLVTGVPRSRWPELGELAAAASANLNPVLRGEQAAAAATAATALQKFLGRHAREILKSDADLSAGERLGILSLIVVGGYEPLADLCSSALSLILDTPSAPDRLRAGGPEAYARAVDEAMRLESPIPFTSRVCVGGYRTDSVDIPPGAPVLAMLGAANRDPAVFDDPDTFVLDRTPNVHLALGGGVHYCLGAAIVKQSTATLLAELLGSRPGIVREPGSASPWRQTLVPRGLSALPVRW